MNDRATLDALVPPVTMACSALVFWNIYDTYAITWLWHNNALAFIDGGCAAIFSRIAYRNIKSIWNQTRSSMTTSQLQENHVKVQSHNG